MDIDTYVWIDTGVGRYVVEFSTDPSGVGVTAYLDGANINNHVQRFIDPAGAHGITAFNVTPYLAEYTVVTRSDISAQAKSDLRAYLQAKKSGGPVTTQPPSTTQPPGTTTPAPTTTSPPGTTTPAPTGTTSPPPTTTPPPAGSSFLQLTSPVRTGVSPYDQISPNGRYVVSVDPATWRINPGTYTFTGIAKNMKNLAVIDANGGWHTILDPGSSLNLSTGEFVVTGVPIPNKNGPTAINVYAWNSPPGDSNYTSTFTLRAELFVQGGVDDRPPLAPPPGLPPMTLVFNEDFKSPILSAATTDTPTAEFWQGSKPSTWEPGSAGEYQDAYFVPSNDPQGRNPFTLFTEGNGYLRIRATYDPNLQDPRGWSRIFWGGGLSTGFPNGQASVVLKPGGYAEARIACATGGTAWNSFWIVDRESIIQANSAKGAVEIDILEQYGTHPTTYQNALHNWTGGNSANGPDVHIGNWVEAGVDMGASMHTWGVRVTTSEVIYYFNGQENWRQPLPRQKGDYYIMLHGSLGGGQGWPTPVPPAGFYDMWIDYLRVWDPA
jgi:hypothetical protein